LARLFYFAHQISDESQMIFTSSSRPSIARSSRRFCCWSLHLSTPAGRACT